MRNLFKLWRRAKAEDGNATVEFVLIVPLFILIFVSIFELGLTTVRLTVLEHGMDRAMRDVRLGTNSTFNREQIRDRVCDYSGMLKGCHDTLLMEMVVIDRDTFDLPPVRATCIDRNETAIPVTNFANGVGSDLMFIRACYVIKPLYPTFGLGAIIKTDAAGRMQLVASSIFAQEPS